MIERVKKNTDPSKVGMITSHLGVVRRTSRNGREVLSIEVAYDQETLQAIVRDIKKMPGIAEVLVETREGRLNVGEEIMAVVVAGDIRENVFPALVSTVNRIKKEASTKKEIRIKDKGDSLKVKALSVLWVFLPFSFLL
jgi:molybdopterin synthase catalytic subunit